MCEAGGFGAAGVQPENSKPAHFRVEAFHQDSKGGALKGGAQIFALFSLSRPHFRSFCPSLGVFTLNFGGVLEVLGPSNVHVLEFSGCRVKPRRPRSRRGSA